MIYSKRGTLYDSSDQSEHRPTDPGEESPDEQRWDNEGGGPHQEESAPDVLFACELTTKPAWSVLSLAELNEAIRRERLGSRSRDTDIAAVAHDEEAAATADGPL